MVFLSFALVKGYIDWDSLIYIGLITLRFQSIYIITWRIAIPNLTPITFILTCSNINLPSISLLLQMTIPCLLITLEHPSLTIILANFSLYLPLIILYIRRGSYYSSVTIIFRLYLFTIHLFEG